MKNIIALMVVLLSSSNAISAENNRWEKIEGGNVVNDQYLLNCDEGSGWQKCGGKNSCEFSIGAALSDIDTYIWPNSINQTLGFPGSKLVYLRGMVVNDAYPIAVGKKSAYLSYNYNEHGIGLDKEIILNTMHMDLKPIPSGIPGSAGPPVKNYGDRSRHYSPDVKSALDNRHPAWNFYMKDMNGIKIKDKGKEFSIGKPVYIYEYQFGDSFAISYSLHEICDFK